MTATKVLDWKPRRGLRGDVCVVFGNGAEMWISVRHLRPDTDDLGDV